MSVLRDTLETQQVKIYFGVILLAVLGALALPGAAVLETGINPALALMLFVTFLQVPLADLGRALLRVRFLLALLFSNFVLIPALVFALMQCLPQEPMIRLGVLMVLLCPCIDYVVTFSHIGKGDAKLLLASTPALLVTQMLLLPGYLSLFLGENAARLVQIEPFVHAFIWLIAIPLALAALVQFAASRSRPIEKMRDLLCLLPVPATALVLFLVFASIVPQVGLALDGALSAVPVYIAFSVAAPIIGWTVAKLFKLEAPARRAIAFSSSTRNSLVVLPLALAVPGAMPLLPAIIVAQTVTELVASLIYMRVMPRLGRGIATKGPA